MVLYQAPLLAMQDYRTNAAAHARQGQDFLERGRYVEAADEFRIALQLNPNAAMAAPLYNNLGIAYRYQGENALALAAFQRASRLQPGFELYYRNIIETYAKKGWVPRAHEALGRIVKLNPQDAEAWYLLGLLYESQGKATEAKNAFSRFLALAPESRLAEAARTHLSGTGSR